MPEPNVDALAGVWSALADLATTFTAEDWATPTECPGWSVQDQYVHVIGIERTVMGEPTPDVDTSRLPHVRNDVGAMNETWIESRRTRSGEEVLAEFREVTTRRLEQIDAMTAEELAAPTWSPVGEVPYRDFLGVRVFDCWIHEQDVRRALRRPGGWDTDAARLSMGQIASALGFVVAKKAAAPEGATVVFDLDDAAPITIAVEAGRGVVAEVPPAAPSVRLRVDREALVALSSGRWEPARAQAAGRVRVEGDVDLAAHVLDEIDFLF